MPDWFKTPEARYIASRRVLIHFNTNDRSLEGYIVKQTRDAYWLQSATLLESERTQFALEGMTIVPRRQVFFVQVLAENGTG